MDPHSREANRKLVSKRFTVFARGCRVVYLAKSHNISGMQEKKVALNKFTDLQHSAQKCDLSAEFSSLESLAWHVLCGKGFV